MISADFASNESWDDALLSLKLLFQPWKWKSGKELDEVKNQIRELFGITDYGLRISLFLSGRSALYFLLKSLNLLKGSEVLVQAFTCEAVVLPIIDLGLKPIYVDIEVDTYSMDYRFLTSKLGNKVTSKQKVLILQHTFGLTPKFRKEILKLAQEKDLIVIEDLAHGFSSKKTIEQYNNYYALLSFGRSKMFSSVFGGAVVGRGNETMEQWNNLEMPSYLFIFLCLLYKPLTMLIKSAYDLYIGKILHKILDSLGLLIPEVNETEKSGNYDHVYNKAYPNGLAILLSNQLTKFDRIRGQRAKISTIYQRSFPENNRYLKLNNPALIRYPLLIKNRDETVKNLGRQNIFLGKWYDQVVAPKELTLSRVGYKTGSCPVAEEICKEIINLPTNISEAEAKRVVQYLNDVK